MPLDPMWGEHNISRMEFTAVVQTSQSREPHRIWGLEEKMGMPELIFGYR